MCRVLRDAASYIRQSDLVQYFANRQGYPLFLCLSPAVTKRGGTFFIFCQLEIFSDKVITSFPFPLNSNNVSSKGSDKGAQSTGVGVVVVLILRVAIDECQFTKSCRLFFPLRAADISLWENPFVAHIKDKLDNITASLRSNVCEDIRIEVHTRLQQEA